MKKLYNLLSLVAVIVLSACSNASYISPSEENVTFTIEGGEQRVTINADGNWEIKECPEWVKTEVQDSVLVIMTQRNETGALRKGDIELKGGDNVEVTISVTQAAKCTHINPETDKVEFEKEGGTQTVKIDTDGSPKVEAPEGFTATYAGGVLTINAPANEAGGKNGEIKLTGDDQSATIAVTQKGNICPKCNGTGKVRCTKCGGKGYTYDEFLESIYGCSKCGGKGKSDRWADYNYRQGSGKMPCPTCGGSGS